MKSAQCYELFRGIAPKNHAFFLFFILQYSNKISHIATSTKLRGNIALLINISNANLDAYWLYPVTDSNNHYSVQ